MLPAFRSWLQCPFAGREISLMALGNRTCIFRGRSLKGKHARTHPMNRYNWTGFYAAFTCLTVSLEAYLSSPSYRALTCNCGALQKVRDCLRSKTQRIHKLCGHQMRVLMPPRATGSYKSRQSLFGSAPCFISTKDHWTGDGARRENRTRDTHWQIRGGRRTPHPNLKTINAIRTQSEKASMQFVLCGTRQR